MELLGKVALVTGGARRVGRAIVLELACAGCDVVVHFDRSRDEADTAAGEVRAMGRRAVSVAAALEDAAAWKSIVDCAVGAFGRLDVLVNNASTFVTDASDTLEAFDPDRWERMLRVNLLAPMGLCHHAAPHLAANGAGRIVNLLDIAAERPWSTHLAYVSSKAALAAMTRALAKALAPGVCVNGIAPGIAVFPESYDEELRRALVERVPLKRAGTPEDIARTVRFLVESGDYITGQIVNVDGGRSLGS